MRPAGQAARGFLSQNPAPVQKSGLRPEPKYIFWPIAISVITTNTMGVINQNEGYEGAENNKPPLTVIDENEN